MDPLHRSRPCQPAPNVPNARTSPSPAQPRRDAVAVRCTRAARARVPSEGRDREEEAGHPDPVPVPVPARPHERARDGASSRWGSPLGPVRDADARGHDGIESGGCPGAGRELGARWAGGGGGGELEAAAARGPRHRRLGARVRATDGGRHQPSRDVVPCAARAGPSPSRFHPSSPRSRTPPVSY